MKPLGFSQSKRIEPPVLPPRSYSPPRSIIIDKWYVPPARDAVAAVIAAAAAEKEQAALRAAAEAEQAEKTRQEKEAKKQLAKKKASEVKQAREGKQLLKEKRLLKLVGAVVVKCMSKYQKQMDHDTFKKYAKEVRIMQCAISYHADV